MSVVMDVLHALPGSQLEGQAVQINTENYEDDGDIFEAEVCKTRDRIGLAYRVTVKNEVIITAVLPDSSVDEWNHNCEPEYTICTGDRILSVGDKDNPKSMVEEMKSAAMCTFRILKSGPRWHILGVTAESMEKIHAAKDKGLTFDLCDPDINELGKLGAEVPLTPLQILTIFISLMIPNILLVALYSDVGAGIKLYTLFAPETRNAVGNLLVFFASFGLTSLYVADWGTWKRGPHKVLLPLVCVYTLFVGAIFKSRFYPQAPLVVILFHVPVIIGLLRALLLRSARRSSFYTGVAVSMGLTAFFLLGVWLIWMLPGTDGGDGFGSGHKWSEATKRGLIDNADDIYKEWKIEFGGAEFGVTERRIYHDIDCDTDLKSDDICLQNWCRAPSVRRFDNWLKGVHLGNLATALPDGNGLYCCEGVLAGSTNTTVTCAKSDVPCHTESVLSVYRNDDGPFCCDSSTKLGSSEKTTRGEYCARVKTTWFLCWVCPFIGFGINTIICLFCLVNGVMLDVADATKIEKTIKQFILMSSILILMMWISTSIAGASMRLQGTLMAFCGTGLVALFVWIYLEIGGRAITSQIRSSRLMQSLVSLATSDWVRALCIICMNVLIPIGILVNCVNQQVRRIRRVTKSQNLFTDGAYKIYRQLVNWNWTSILLKVNWLVCLYWTLSIGVAKLTYVFLSWLNEQLLTIDLVVVIIIFFVIGLLLFLLPPVPGLPVYFSSGIVLAARSRSISGVGFGGGCVIACALSFVLKLTAVSGQYYIGYFMGKSVKIQQMVGVDKVFTRAIEKILKSEVGVQNPGKKRSPFTISIPQVAVLVGGPDWPTSVLCGILRLSLIQCLLGTCPVILVSSPVVLAGAFMAGPDDPNTNEKKSGIWDTLASTMVGISALGQLASGVTALYYIQEVVQSHGDELAMPRKEHEPVAALTKKEADFVRAYNEVTDWQHMHKERRPIVLFVTFLFLLSLFIFMFMDEACFRPFQVSGKISDPFEDQGLDNNAFNIVKWPGLLAHIVFFVGLIGHLLFLRWAKAQALTTLVVNTETRVNLEDAGIIQMDEDAPRSLTDRVSRRASGSALSKAIGGIRGSGSIQRSGTMRRSGSRTQPAGGGNLL